MYAGTIARLSEPTDDPVQSRFDGQSLPALDVETTQSAFDDRPIQQGHAADRTETTAEHVAVGGTGDDRWLEVDRTQERQTIHTEWVADVTGTGVIAAESTGGDGPLAFPFDQFYFATGTDIKRLRVDVEAMYLAWRDEDTLGDVWLNASDPGDGAAMQYHQQADAGQKPTIGLGFERPWNGSVVEGVVYASGYVALYSVESATRFIRFVADELLPHCEPCEDDAGGEQTTLDADEDICDNCGRETTVEEYLGGQYCPTCIDAHDDPGAALDLSEVAP